MHQDLPHLIWLLSSPEAVENMAVWEDPQHDVVGGCVMDEGPLGVDKEHIRHPYFLHQTPVEGHALVGYTWEGQPLILPVVPQIQSHGEVLVCVGGGGSEKQTASGLSVTMRTKLACLLWGY